MMISTKLVQFRWIDKRVRTSSSLKTGLVSIGTIVVERIGSAGLISALPVEQLEEICV